MTGEVAAAPDGHGDRVAGDFSGSEHIAVGILYIVFGVGGVVTNLLLIWTLLKDKSLLRGASPWLHIGLAVANIGVVAPSPFTASSNFSGKWLYGDAACKAYAFEGIFVGLAAIGFVVALCVERYVVSKRSVRQNPSLFYWVVTAIIVVNALFWATMPLLGWSRYGVDNTGAACAIDWNNPDDGYVSYVILLSIFCFGLPVLFALLALCKASPDSAPAGIADSASAQQADLTSGEQEFGMSNFTESHPKWLCLALLVLVVTGWGPFALLCVWAMVGDTAGVSMLAACLPPLACKFMTIIYPLVYNVASPRFRAGFCSLIRGASSES